jgi:hypothetical protein
MFLSFILNLNPKRQIIYSVFLIWARRYSVYFTVVILTRRG